MAVIYLHLTYDEYKELEKQMRAFKESSHKTEGGFYHKSIRLAITDSLTMEFHGPLVGGYGHNPKPAVECRHDWQSHWNRLDLVCSKCGEEKGPAIHEATSRRWENK